DARKRADRRRNGAERLPVVVFAGDHLSLIGSGEYAIVLCSPREDEFLGFTRIWDRFERLAAVGRLEQRRVRTGFALPRSRRAARRGGVQPPIDRERLPEISVIDVPIESRPRLPGVAGAIQPVATGGNVGL